jgi:hypothetical protein
MSKRRWPWGRIVLGVLAVVIALVFLPLFPGSREMRRRADDAQATRLARLKADLSKPGEYETTFQHNYPSAWGLYLQLVAEPPIKSTEEAAAALDGLAGHFVIVAPDGSIFDKESFAFRDFASRRLSLIMPPEEGIAMRADNICQRWQTTGTYKVKLTVDHGAQKLAGRPHSLILRYEFDGFEYGAAQIAWLIGVAACSVSGFLVLMIVVITIVKRSSRKEDQQLL